MEINMNKELAEICILLSKYKGATKEQKNIFKTYSKVFMSIVNNNNNKKLITEEELYSFTYKEATRDYPMKYYPNKEWLKFRKRFKYFYNKLDDASLGDSDGGLDE